ncbi:MAG: rod shape-determining protein RodA [Bacteroidota bacterium]|jgi:rod shape determining protein RodA|nr:rod shape-determining protein RodA [Bacteroidota bacterium]
MQNTNNSLFQRIDTKLLFVYLLLVLIGMSAVFSVEYRATDVSIFLMSKSHMKQAIWLGVSLFVGMLILFTESKFFASFAYLGYALGLTLLVLTIFLGKDVKGSHSWLGIGSFAFQPGEVCKIFTALALAKFLSSPETNFNTWKFRMIGIGLALFPAMLIILQKETGLALVYFSFFLVMYREGLPISILAIGFSLIVLTITTLLLSSLAMFIVLTLLAALIAYLSWRDIKRNVTARGLLIGIWAVCILFSQFIVPITFKKVLQGYQIDRIYSMLGQEVPDKYRKDTEDGHGSKKGNASDYNVTQSKIAIGSGGFWGKGFLNGTQTKNDFVPEQHTDFIFCAIGEQFGFVGSLGLIGLYIFLMIRIIVIGERQRSAFSRIYAYGVAAILFFHFAINISMTIGLAPVIGITLPFLSYGGSSLLSFSVLIFILMRLDADRQVLIR